MKMTMRTTRMSTSMANDIDFQVDGDDDNDDVNDDDDYVVDDGNDESRQRKVRGRRLMRKRMWT